MKVRERSDGAMNRLEEENFLVIELIFDRKCSKD